MCKSVLKCIINYLENICYEYTPPYLNNITKSLNETSKTNICIQTHGNK